MLITCTICNRELPLSAFYRRLTGVQAGYVMPRCRPCSIQSGCIGAANFHKGRPKPFSIQIVKLCDRPDGTTHAELCDKTGQWVPGKVVSSLVERGLIDQLHISCIFTQEPQRRRPRKKWRTTPGGRLLVREFDMTLL